ncbi:MAG: ATP-grasp domain-containing protein [Dehalococcoidia bacterium]|nr:ATP-grasp domain-containing protein [Dehalococcoidia bacterium]
MKEDGLFVVVGGSKSQVPFIQAAKDMGFKTVVFDRDQAAPGTALADVFYPISTHDTIGILDRCRQMTREQPLAGIITSSAYTLPLKAVAQAAEMLGTKSFSVNTVELVNDKSRMKGLFCCAGIPTPKWAKATSDQAATSFFRQCGSPIIIKPASGTMGSAGVSLVTIEAEISPALADATKASRDGTALLEEFCPGREFSIGGIVADGKVNILALLEKHNLGRQHHFTISGFDMGPHKADGGFEKKVEAILRVARQTVTILEINNSFFTVDLLLTDGGPLVLEAGVLLDAKVDRLLAFSGIAVYDMICRVATGQSVKFPEPSFKRGYAIKFIFSDRAGKLRFCKRQEGTASANRYIIEWWREEGDYIQPPVSIADTLGWVMVEAEDAGFAYETASKIASQEHFEIEDDQ